MNELVTSLTGRTPQRGRWPDSTRGQFTKRDARLFLCRFIAALQRMGHDESIFIPALGTFKKSQRVARRIVGFDGETVYKQPASVVLTFRMTRPTS